MNFNYNDYSLAKQATAQYDPTNDFTPSNISFNDYATFDKQEGYKKSTIVPENIAFKIKEDDVYSNARRDKKGYPIGKTGRRNRVAPAEIRCSATCLTGEQCSKASIIESEYCRMHDQKLNPDKYRRKKVAVVKNNDKVATNNCMGSNCSIMGGRKRTKRHTKKHNRRTRKR